MKWKLLAFTKGVTGRLRRFHSLKKHHPNQMNLKKYQGLLMIQAREGQKPKKASRSSDGKKTTTKAGEKVKKTSLNLNLLTQVRKRRRRHLKMMKRKKYFLCWGVKEEVQSFFDLQKDSKNLTIKKKVGKVVFMAGPYEGYVLSYVALCDTKYLKRVLKK